MAKKISLNKTEKRIQPCFKFLEERWANEMLEFGSVKISPMREFRKSHHGGLIQDDEEGIAHFHSLTFGTRWEGVFNNSIFDVDIGDAFIYCTTSNIFSETLNWALKENGRSSCVLITDIQALHSAISDELHPDLRFLGERNCEYLGRNVHGVGIPPSNPTQRMKETAAWRKPRRFAEQAEFRGVWVPKADLTEPIAKRLPAIKDFLIPVDLSEFDANLCFDRLAIEIKTTTQVHRADLEFIHPIQSYSPMIFWDGDTHLLGLEPKSNWVRGASLKGPSQYNVFASSVSGTLLLCVRLEDVLSISYKSI